MGKAEDVQGWAEGLVRKIVEAERLGGGFRLVFAQAASEIVERVATARDAERDAVVQWLIGDARRDAFFYPGEGAVPIRVHEAIAAGAHRRK